MEQYRQGETEYVSLFLPGLGNVSITYEDEPWEEDPKKQLVVSLDFDPFHLRIVDQYGNTRTVR